MNFAPVLFTTLPAAHGRRIGIATLNAEASLNALSMPMVQLLSRQLQAWESDAAIAVVVLQAAGDKAFCAGGDLQALYASMRAQHAGGRGDDLLGNACALDFFTQEYRLDYQIHTYRKPILCWGHGIVMGGGIGLMAGASHRVVTESSRLAMPEIAVGLFPDVGGSWFLNRMPGRLGLFLALTGAAVNAADALFVKLADHHLPHAGKAGVLDALAAQGWSERDSDNHCLLSHLLQAREEQSGHGPLRRHFDLIEQLCRGPQLAEIVQQITTCDSAEPWLQKAAAALQNGNPASAWLAHALQQRCRHLSLAEVFRVELVAALACAAGPDFAEGIRALIVDKDRRPHWQMSDVAEISAAWGERYFRSPWSADDHPLRDLA